MLLACAMIALPLAVLAGGRMTDLAATEPLRHAPLIPIALVLTSSMTLDFLSRQGLQAHVAWLAGSGALVFCMASNWRRPGAVLAAVGVSANAVVVFANRGMPVLAPATSAARLANDTLHLVAGPSTRLVALADVVSLDLGLLGRTLVSAGDGLLALGVMVMIIAASLRHPDGR